VPVYRGTVAIVIMCVMSAKFGALEVIEFWC